MQEEGSLEHFQAAWNFCDVLELFKAVISWSNGIDFATYFQSNEKLSLLINLLNASIKFSLSTFNLSFFAII